MHSTKSLLILAFAPLWIHFEVQDRSAESRPASGPSPEASAEATKAIKQLYDRPILRMRGEVKLEKEDPGAMGGAVMILGGPGGGAPVEPFEGDFETIEGNGDTTVLSEHGGLGFGIYTNGDRRFARETYEEDHYDISTFQNEILALLDRANVQRKAVKADWNKTSNGELTIYSAKLDRKLIPAKKSNSPIGPTEKVIRVDADITVQKSGEIIKIEFRVMKKDPLAAMLKNARANAPDGVEPSEHEGEEIVMKGSSIQLTPRDLTAEPKDTDKGPVTTYTLEIVNGEPPARILEFQKSMSALARKNK